MEQINRLYEKGIRDIEKEDLELVHKFFVVFSYMEYMLKQQGFCDGGERGVFVNWDRFANHFATNFNFNRNEALIAAISYIVGNPPQKQFYENSTLIWRETAMSEEVHLRDLLVIIRRIRNNLFHGGKFPLSGNGEEENRNIRLIESSLSILNECLVIISEVTTGE